MTETGHAAVAGGRLYYEVDGESKGGEDLSAGEDQPALVLLHAGIANLRMWDPQVPAFAERYRVVRYDTRGYGETTSQDVAFSNRQDLLELLDQLGIALAHLVGCSRGGMIALDFTLEHPERVRSLVAVASGPGGLDAKVGDELKALWSEMERLEEAKDWEPLTDREVALWVDGPGQPADRVAPEVRESVRGWILDSYRQHGDEQTEPQPLQPPAVGRLSEVRVPTLVIMGDLDNDASLAASETLADGIADARRVVFRGAAHLPNLEQPEGFTKVVLDFLAEVDEAGAESAAGSAAGAVQEPR
jgi:3-oxoadipate enol-lactonase